MSPFLNSLFQNDSCDPDLFFLIAGPCVAESADNMHQIAQTVKAICERLHIPYVFKASYRKANRTSSSSFTGLGDEKALELLADIKKTYQLPVTTDIHTAEEAKTAAAVADILQIPAFLCRQSDLLEAAAITGKIINIKKGQFLSGPAMKFAAEKIRKAGNDQVILSEKGNSFGYQDLVVDFRNIPWMKEHGTPVVMDCTHSLQQPNQTSGVTGGNPQMIGTIAKAAIATGADGIFIETHPDPASAKSDGANMLKLDQLEELLTTLVKIRRSLI